ncbi:DUF4440 domain-containing protein [Spirosoma gilvum]
MKTRIILVLLLLCFTKRLFAQQPTSTFPATDLLPSVTLPPDVARVLRDYERAWQARDADALVALFTPDGFVMQPNRPAIRGHANIKLAYSRSAGSSLSLRALSFEQSGTVGYIIGAYRGSVAGPDIGKFILTLRKGADGRWLITADMDNSTK